MGKKRLLWINFSIFLLVILLCIGVVGELALSSLRQFYERSQADSLTAMAQLVRGRIELPLERPGAAERAAQLARDVARDAAMRLTLIDAGGKVLADSEEEPAKMENHAGRPEVRPVLRGEAASWWDVRFSNTVKTQMLYVAIPCLQGGRVAAVVRLARPLARIDAEVAGIRAVLVRSGLIAALIAGALSFYLSRRMSRPIEIIREAAERYGRGDYSQRLFIAGPAEFVDLAKSMNRMAREINNRIRQITLERNERDAILLSMREGVLAVDRDERIMMINPSAEALLGVQAGQAVGRLVQEVLRHAELQRFLAKALAGQAMAPEENLLRWPAGRLLQIESAPLRDEEGADNGLLVVINDVTRLHKLENIRREFVANVSHELRTPITSIKGFIETLRDGAIDDPENAGRFLEIIARQADRLNAIIEDLLALSRIEREAEGEGIKTAPFGLRPFLETVVQHFGPQSREKKIEIALECPPEIVIKANQQLLEQAVGNLLDNAIKYSPRSKPIIVRAAREGERVRIVVADQGVGIPAQHLPRIFERFYRVDPARSREAGGTGLGLAIVKHIAQAHGGQVAVESAVGQGSTFTLDLPALAATPE